MSNNLEIYFHVGLGKTGSTYLQKKFFPNLKGINYLPTNRYRRSKKLLAGKQGKYLLSREFDIQLRQQLRWFVSSFPQTKVIVVFRKHEEWILSQYKRHVKNGWFKGFDSFFSLKDPSYWKKEDLKYADMIKYIEEKTGRKPLVLLYDELEKKPHSYLSKIATFTGAQYDAKKISSAKVHTSYSDKQLSFLELFTKNVFRRFPNDHTNNKWKHWLIFRPWWALYHVILYMALLIPKGLIPRGDFPSEETLKAISNYYENDWKTIKEIAEDQSVLIAN